MEKQTHSRIKTYIKSQGEKNVKKINHTHKHKPGLGLYLYITQTL